MEKLKSFSNTDSLVSTLKGDVAEFWHAGTYNISAALKDSSNRAFVERSHDYGSIDISTNFDDVYGSKYYSSGFESAKQQSKSILEKFNEYKANGGKEEIDEYLRNRKIPDDAVLSDPVYSGQLRLIPSDQMKDAIAFLERKIAKEELTRPEQVNRYKETLSLLRDRISDGDGAESIPLTKEDAEKLARLAKENKIDPAELKLTTEELVKFEYVMKQAFKAGLSAATVSLVLKIAPEICSTIVYLIENGEIDKEQYKKIGIAAVQGTSEGFIKGTISAAITACCKSGLLGEALKELDPTIIGSVTVIAFDTMKNAYKVSNKQMSSYELTNDLIKEMFVSTCSMIAGGITRSFIQVPVLGFMIGSFIGSIAGTFVYNTGRNIAISFCIETGFTMFGLVHQDYKLPEEVIKQIGIDVFEYDKYDFIKFEYNRFEFSEFEPDRFNHNAIDIKFLRRGVIGVSQIGYI